jgi:peptidoglycan-N-acetylglucosamine deacetylase
MSVVALQQRVRVGVMPSAVRMAPRRGAAAVRRVAIGALVLWLLIAPIPPSAESAPNHPSGAAFAAVARVGLTSFDRAAGADRYATAAQLSRRLFGADAPVAYVATGEDHADGLAAGPAAARHGGPVLLTRREALPPATVQELMRLRPQRIVVVGGTAAVSADVESSLEAYDAGGGVTRAGGPDRYATAAALAASTTASDAETVYVASGTGFPDALSGGGAAAASGAPLLLVGPMEVPGSTAAELRRLRPRRIVVVGGTRAVSTAVADELQAYASRPIERLSGPDRFATSAAVARATWPGGAPMVLVTTGEDFPDAVVAGAAAGRLGAPILLSARDHVPWHVWEESRRLAAPSGLVIGGAAVVPDARVATLQRGCHSSLPASPATVQTLSSLPGASGQIALTFDMGGRLNPAMDILGFLVDSDVCATIFPTGALGRSPEGQQVLGFLRDHPDLFEVGNHTMHHCDLVRGGGGSPTTAPCPGGRPAASFVQRELTDAAAIISAGIGRPLVPYWRPPYGSVDAAVLGAAAVVGYSKTILWSIDTIDWRPVAEGGPTARQISDKAVSSATSGAIVLMHLGGWNTRAALDTMVPRLRAAGLTPTSLSQMSR